MPGSCWEEGIGGKTKVRRGLLVWAEMASRRCQSPRLHSSAAASFCQWQTVLVPELWNGTAPLPSAMSLWPVKFCSGERLWRGTLPVAATSVEKVHRRQKAAVRPCLCSSSSSPYLGSGLVRREMAKQWATPVFLQVPHCWWLPSHLEPRQGTSCDSLSGVGSKPRQTDLVEKLVSLVLCLRLGCRQKTGMWDGDGSTGWLQLPPSPVFGQNRSGEPYL